MAYGIWNMIGEMLNKLPKANSVSSEISESNIMVDTPVYN